MWALDQSSLEAVRNKSLFYPCAGHDWKEVLSVFGDYVDEFWFSDICYRDLTNLPTLFSSEAEYRFISSRIIGPVKAEIESRTDARPYRELKPGTRIDVFERAKDGRYTKVIRRRGFGQYALKDFSDASIGVFVHRGDSPGEGGSNVYYLANKARDHEPCTNLFEKLSRKLTNPALIVTDGSNAGPSALRRQHNRRIDGATAFHSMKSNKFLFGSLNWRCVGYLGNRYGPTLVWEVSKQQV